MADAPLFPASSAELSRSSSVTQCHASNAELLTSPNVPLYPGSNAGVFLASNAAMFPARSARLFQGSNAENSANLSPGVKSVAKKFPIKKLNLA